MKKAVSLALCILLTAMTMLPVLAQTEEEAMLLAVKERIGSTEEYETFNSSVMETEQGKDFVFEWQGEKKSLLVTVNQEKMITEYRKYDWSDSSEDSLHFDRPSMAQAMEQAEQLIAILNPDLEFNLNSDSNVMDLRSDRIEFTVQRTYQGLPIIGDEGYVSLNITGNMILGFSMHYTQALSFEPAQAAVSQEQARQLYAQKLTPKLYYIEEIEEEDQYYFPAYRLQDDLKYISGMDGEVVEIEQNYRAYPSNAKGSSQFEAADQEAFLTPEELKHLDEVEGLLSKDQLEKSLRENSLLSLDRSLPLKSFERQMAMDNDYLSSLYFMNGEDWSKGADATMNAQTGELIYFNDHTIWNQEEQTEHNEEAEQKAFDQLSQRAGEFRYDKDANRFVRYYNDIPFENDYAAVTLNEQGKVAYYNLRYGKSEVRSAQDAISAVQAAGLMFEQRDYTLHFLPVEGVGRLVYAIEDKPQRIDAFTGEVGFDWEREIPEKSVYTDLEGHYAKDAVEALASFGIGFESGEFYPDQTITVREYSDLLYRTFVRTPVKPEQVEQWMSQKGFLPEDVNWDSALNRKTAASMLVCAMGYGKVAQLQDIYRAPFADVIEDMGAIAILSAMGIVSGNGDGLFYPDQSITRAEAMILLYRYLSC